MNVNELESRPTRPRCYDCFRPTNACVCGELPRIVNQTELLLVQHRREHFHRFNTARLVHKAFVNATLIADNKQQLADRLAELGQPRPDAGLLFPGDDALLIDDLPSADRPRQLVVVDGTWHQAKTLVRDIPALRNLPRYRLAPTSPSRFKIRREPNAEALSTVEAVVATLRVFEPETAGFDQLLEVFYRMVDRQDEHPKLEANRRVVANRGRTLRNIPLALIHHPERIVVAYGESTVGGKGSGDRPRRPLVWVAQRLLGDEGFRRLIESDEAVDEKHLAHLELTRDDFRSARPLAEVRESWAKFLRPDDLVVVYHPGVARLLDALGSERTPRLVLKSVDFDLEHKPNTLEQWIELARLIAPEPLHPGRAGRRLANALALVKHLRELVLAHQASGRTLSIHPAES